MAALPGLRLVGDPAWGTTNYQSCWLEVLPEHPMDREQMMEHLAAAGISARRGIMAAHRQPAHAERTHGPLPVTERLTDATLDPAAVPPDDRRRAASACATPSDRRGDRERAGPRRRQRAGPRGDRGRRPVQHDGPVQIVDDDPARWGTLHGLAPVLGGVDLVTGLVDHEVLLTLGKGRLRRRVATRLAMVGLGASRYATAAAPAAGAARAAATSVAARSPWTAWC